VITRFPAPSVEGGRDNPDIGLALMVNEDETGAFVMRTIQYYLQDKILGLKPVDWDKRWVVPSYEIN
jgi:hypothetical protein